MGRSRTGPVYAAISVTLAGGKDVLGLWAGQGGEGAKFWMSVLTDLRTGIKDVFFVVCDGLKGLSEVVANAWPAAIVQTCIVHYADLGIPEACGTCTAAFRDGWIRIRHPRSNRTGGRSLESRPAASPVPDPLKMPVRPPACLLLIYLPVLARVSPRRPACRRMSGPFCAYCPRGRRSAPELETGPGFSCGGGAITADEMSV
jgi:hypothetical protein